MGGNGLMDYETISLTTIISSSPHRTPYASSWCVCFSVTTSYLLINFHSFKND